MSASEAQERSARTAGADRGRRSLLAAMGWGVAGALGAAACGTSTGGAPSVHLNRRTPGADADALTLNQLLAAEYHSIAAYTAATPLLTGSQAKVARQFLGQEVLHADRLISLIGRAGGQAQQPKASYDLGHSTSPADLMQLLLRIERAQLEAYLQATPVLTPGSLTTTVASISATQAQHAAVWRLQLGEMPAPTAFVTGND